MSVFPEERTCQKQPILDKKAKYIGKIAQWIRKLAQ